uniref:FAD-dependent oxidoreductase FVFD30 n=1 Tax=Flammulina velutipes TaxID=38945 RepID=FD30_FLAVE|nr:hypothetical protein [Flammulina velutipes]
MLVSDRDKLEDKALIPLDNIFHNGKGTLVQASVTSVEKEKTGGFVVLDNGEKLPFYVLVVATGSKWSGPVDFPSKPEDVTKWISEQRKKFKDAKNIVIAGGGSVGLELSGEIKDIWPEKSVTIVHSQKKLLNSVYPDKFRDRAAQAYRPRTKLVLDDQIPGELTPGATSVTTRNGKTITADLIVPAWGNKPNTALLSSLKDVLSPNGCVKIRDTFQTQAYPDIFALGDIIDVNEQKQAGKAQAHAGMVAANVLSYVQGQPLKQKYKGSYELIVITNGKNDGVGYFGVWWGIVIGGWLASLLKAKDLMLPATRVATGASK